ncbi:MAG: isoamylase early set domain-containing protein [Candidatus Krumholzibacteria bacterium]|nr:isoamylase early set domain-containing protein [Candidatus Krumholzibacteria bacterium]
MFNSDKHLILYVVMPFLLFAALSLSWPGQLAADNAEYTVKQQLTSFLQSGADPGVIQENHLLYPVTRYPVLATTILYLFGDDPALLERLYPRINNIVMRRFASAATTAEGFIPGDGSGNAGNDVYSSPSLNALASIELHALHMIAARIGALENALELQNWSRQFSSAVVNTFFDHTRGCFYPISSEGNYIIRHSPDLLLPLVMDRSLSTAEKRRIADRLMHNMENMRSGVQGGNIWNDPAIRPLIVSLLSGIEDFPAARLAGLTESPIHRSHSGSRPVGHASPWSSIWNDPGILRDILFPPSEKISSLLIFMDIMQREKLLVEKLAPGLVSDVDSLTEILALSSASMDEHISNTKLVNSLLIRFGDISNRLKNNEKIWKVVDDIKWKRLSPRTKKQTIFAATEAVDELNRSKHALTQIFMKESGIRFAVAMPDMAIPLGKSIKLEVSIMNGSKDLVIDRALFQMSGNRWNMTDDGATIRIGAGDPPWRWKKTFNLPPGSVPGVIELSAFIDFMTDGKRVEIHFDESLILTTGYDVTFDMPEGRKFADDMILPANITIRYRSAGNTQGEVDGVFLDGIRCSPELPARFVVNGGSEITELPIQIARVGEISPGVYPFSLSVSLDGTRLAFFENELIVPMEWLHMGPVTNRTWALEDGVQLQDDLSRSYLTPEGKRLGWASVADGAMDHDGRVMPDHLYGAGTDRGMLLYTVISVKKQSKVLWKLDTRNIVSLWINSSPVLEAESGRDSRDGAIILRKGKNSILIATYWPLMAAPLSFSMMDESGLPVPGLRNDLSGLIGPQLASLEGGTEMSGANDEDGRPQEIDFEVSIPDAKEVTVIGEFNNWAPHATPMIKGPNGRWSVTLLLMKGTYQYKFLIDRKIKIVDPSNNTVEPDGFGGMNSVLTIR